MAVTVKIEVEVINGFVLEFPQVKYFSSDKLSPIGLDMVRYFNDELCSVVKKTFSFRYGFDLYGTKQFTSIEQFNQFIASGCCQSENCDILELDCWLMYNTCTLTYKI